MRFWSTITRKTKNLISVKNHTKYVCKWCVFFFFFCFGSLVWHLFSDRIFHVAVFEDVFMGFAWISRRPQNTNKFRFYNIRALRFFFFYLIFVMLDSESYDECIGFTMTYALCFLPVHNFLTRICDEISDSVGVLRKWLCCFFFFY